MSQTPALSPSQEDAPQHGASPGDPAGRSGDETTLLAGVPGPSGTGELTDAGADPSAGQAAGTAQEAHA